MSVYCSMWKIIIINCVIYNYLPFNFRPSKVAVNTFPELAIKKQVLLFGFLFSHNCVALAFDVTRSLAVILNMLLFDKFLMKNIVPPLLSTKFNVSFVFQILALFSSVEPFRHQNCSPTKMIIRGL